MFLNEEQDELDWLAFQYVAGDLDADAAAAFELRLADDQAAREAVARAVDLGQVVAAAESQCRDDVGVGTVALAERRAVAWGTRLSWMAVGGLLSLLIVTWLNGTFNRSPDGSDRGLSSSFGSELAAAWFETRQQLRTAGDVGPLHPLYSGMTDEDLAAEMSDESSLAIDTPTWMTAAVAGVAGQGSEHDPDDEESVVN